VIRLKRVRRALGKTWLTVEYDVPSAPGVRVEADLDCLTLRRVLLARRRQLGRRPTRSELRQLIIAWVEERRAEHEAVEHGYDFTDLVGVDLEGVQLLLAE
jgi:hypothetical protein